MVNGRLRPPTAEEKQSGFSLIELLVSMGIFTIFLALFMSAVIGLTKGTSKTQITAQTTGEVVSVFKNLDRQVRYADAINAPGTAGGFRYIEFRTPASSSNLTPAAVLCTQWRYSPATGVVQMRKWKDVTAAVMGEWMTQLTDVIDTGAATYPFDMIPATSNGSTKQRLKLSLNAGNAALNANTEISTTYVARNSSTDSISNVVVAGASTLPVCLSSGNRP